MNRRHVLANTAFVCTCGVAGCLNKDTTGEPGGVTNTTDTDTKDDEGASDSLQWHLNVQYRGQTPDEFDAITATDDPLLADESLFQNLFDEAVAEGAAYIFTSDREKIERIHDIWVELPYEDDGAPRFDHDGNVLIGDWGSDG